MTNVYIDLVKFITLQVQQHLPLALVLDLAVVPLESVQYVRSLYLLVSLCPILALVQNSHYILDCLPSPVPAILTH
jgi:hypothetical protein